MSKNIMIRCLIIFFIAHATLPVFAQKTDSIKFSNGFLYYHEYGKGETIVLLTGGPGNNCSQLVDMTTKLSMNNRVILLEERGTGLSIPNPFDSNTVNIQTTVSDLNLLLDHLGLKEAIVCGHSWGATIAFCFASAYPDRVKSLIIISPSSMLMGKELRQTLQYNRIAKWKDQENKRMEILTRKMNSEELTKDETKEYRYLILSGFVANPARLDSLMPYMDVPRNQKTQQLLFKDVAKSKIDLRTSLVAFKKPVYIVAGRQDILSFADYEYKILFPSYELHWIQDCGHYPMFEQPEAFYKIIFDILARQR
jgi:pimeloyl-ACP methyl ester carboxylesterase